MIIKEISYSSWNEWVNPPSSCSFLGWEQTDCLFFCLLWSLYLPSWICESIKQVEFVCLLRQLKGLGHHSRCTGSLPTKMEVALTTTCHKCTTTLPACSLYRSLNACGTLFDVFGSVTLPFLIHMFKFPLC